MPYGPQDSAIKVNKNIEERIANAKSGEEIKSILAEAAVDQKLVVPDRYDPQVLLPTEPGTAPRGFARTVTIDGQKHILEAATEQELVQKETALYRAALGERGTTEQTRDEQGRFTSDQDQRDEAEAAHRDGGGTTDIEKGLVERYLQEIGISPDALREVSNAREQQSWADATQQFLATHPSWPGSEPNVRVIFERITSIPELLNAADGEKADALDAAYHYAKENNLLVANPETEQAERIANCKSPSELRDILNYREPGSSIWGGR